MQEPSTPGAEVADDEQIGRLREMAACCHQGHPGHAAEAESGIGHWRVGAKVNLNVYDGDRPVCQCHTVADARRIVAAVNALAQAGKDGKSDTPASADDGVCGGLLDAGPAESIR